jgi:tRNA(Ile)-lysidine synthase TilS/MesJ
MYNYDVEVYLDHLSKPKIICRGEDIVFTKKFFRFTKEGNVEPFIIHMDKNSFIDYYNERIKRVMKEKCGVTSGDKIGIGFSGGVDSCSFLLSLKNTELLKDLEVTAITVTGVPDAETIKGVEHTKYLTSQLKIPHLVSKPEDIEEIFNLRKPFVGIVNELLKNRLTASKAIFLGHAVIRRVIEEYSREVGIQKICFCIEAEGMIANIISSLISGYPLLGIFRRRVKNFEYIYPLSLFTKRENLLYLFFENKKLLLQEPSGNVHRRAPDLRTISFILFEEMNMATWGIYEYIIEGFNNLLDTYLRFSESKIQMCKNCKGIFLKFQELKSNDTLCPVCQTLSPYIR